MAAANDRKPTECRERTQGLLAASYGPSVDDLDVEARVAVEGHRPLGLTLLDPRTGERVNL